MRPCARACVGGRSLLHGKAFTRVLLMFLLCNCIHDTRKIRMAEAVQPPSESTFFNRRHTHTKKNEIENNNIYPFASLRFSFGSREMGTYRYPSGSFIFALFASTSVIFLSLLSEASTTPPRLLLFVPLTLPS